MANITLALPDHVHKRMKQFPEIRWSEVARGSIVERLAALERINHLLRNSKLTERDAKELGELVTRRMAKRFRNSLLTQTSSSQR